MQATNPVQKGYRVSEEFKSVARLTRLQTCEERKEEYSTYLDKAGINDAITKGEIELCTVAPYLTTNLVLISLYEQPEKPPNALDFVKKYFGAPTNVDITQLQNEHQELKDENQELKKIITELSKRNQELKERVEELED